MYPSLSLEGWVADPQKILNYILADYFIVNKSQDVLLAKRGTSAQYLIAKFGETPAELADAMQTALDPYLRSYFDNVDVLATHRPLAGETEQHTRYAIDLEITVTLNQIRVKTTQSYSVEDNVFKRLVEANNG